jgi:hypothetical protein
MFNIFRSILYRDVLGFSYAAENKIGDSGCTAVAGALQHLSALQVLNIGGDYFRYILLETPVINLSTFIIPMFNV